MEFSPFESIHPCFACFGQNKDEFPLTVNQADIRLKSPFEWKDKSSFPPITDEDIPPHLPLLEKLNIPHIIDIHTHFFPEFVMKLIWRWFDGVNWPIAYRFSEEHRIESLHRNKIYQFTTLNYAHKKEMASWLNDWTFNNYKNWIGAIPFGTFYPESDTLNYVKKAVEVYEFKGFKLHCEVGKFDLNERELAPTFSYLQECQIPIIIHTGTAPKPGEFTGLQFFYPFIKKYPNLKVIIAHMGAHEIQGYAALLEEFSNLYLDTTMVFVDFLATGENTDFAIPLLDRFQDRIFFGSDFPNIPYNVSHPICNLLNLPISDTAKAKILYKNAKYLLA